MFRSARWSAAILATAVVLIVTAEIAPGVASGAPAPGAASTRAARPAPLLPAPLTRAALARALADRPDPFPASAGRGSSRAAALPGGTWQPLGPAAIGPAYVAGGGFYGGVNSGRITAVAVVPSGAHAGRTVVGTAGGGVWTSDDDGATWTPRTDGAPGLAIGALAGDPSNPDHLIAGTGEANQCGDCYPGFGILSSIDGGQTWTPQDPGGFFTGDHIAAVAIDPSNSAHMLAATDRGLVATTDGGTSWSKPADASYAAVDGNISAVVFDPSNPTTIYIGGGAAIVAKSSDSGVHWTPARTGIAAPSGSFPFVALALAPSSPATLYASVGSTHHVAVYRTTNGAGSWLHLGGTPDFTGQAYAYGGGTSEQGWYDNALAVDPADADHVVAGGIAVVASTNGGATWTNVNGHSYFGGGSNRLHPDVHALSFRGGGTVWIGSDGGMFLYDPGTHRVTNANGNLNITQFYFGFNAVNGTVLAGSQDNGSARTSGAMLRAWTGVFSGDGGPSAITPNRPSMQFIESDQFLFRTTSAFTNDVRDITPLAGGVPQLGLFTPPMIVVPSATTPSNPTVFYGGPDLYRTTNPSLGTPTWTKVTSVGDFVSAIAASPSDPHTVYVAFADGVIEVSTDGGATFTALRSQPFAATYVTGLSVDPGNPKAIAVSVSFNDTRSRLGSPHVAEYSWTGNPATGSWAVITGNLPPLRAVSRVVYDHGALVAATDKGVYGTGAVRGRATRWTRIGVGLPNVQAQDLDVEPGGLYVVTHGRGAWRLAAR